jgi:hypothetical protein
MIYQTVNLYSFRDAFVRAGRADHFTYDGLSFIFDYLADSGQDVELDVIALCCDFAESDWESIASENEIDLSDCDEDESINAVREYLETVTVVIGESDGLFVYANF